MTDNKIIMDKDYKQWIKSHQNDEYSILIEDDKLIKLVTDYGEALINFIEIDEYRIVEFKIIINKSKEVKFYLHFELNDEAHAKQLYDEMVETLLNLKNEKTLKILLSCTAGLTTSMFAENLNSVVDMLGLDYRFNAVSYLNIYEEVENYDVILIAPQIGYMLNRLKESLPHKLILQIPTASFASYDALSTIKFVQNELENFNEDKSQDDKEECTHCIQYEKRILSIVISIDRSQTRIYYRLNDKCEIIDSNKIIKSSMNIGDLHDIIDTIILKHSYIDVIGIATPGIVYETGKLKMPTNGRIIDIKNDFEKKYNVDVFVYNNANAAAVGFALEHPEYKNIIFHSQPFGFGVGGEGIIVNGKIVVGKNGVAGEMRFFLRRMQLSNDAQKLSLNQSGVLELITKSLLPTISIIGPDAVALYAPMACDMYEVKQSLKSFVGEEYLPEFYCIKEPSSYMLSGIKKLCVDCLEEENH